MDVMEKLAEAAVKGGEEDWPAVINNPFMAWVEKDVFA